MKFQKIRFLNNDYGVSRDGRVFRYKTGKELKPYRVGKYFGVDVYLNGKRKVYLVHRLVAMVFIPNPENKKEVNHKDGITSRNFIRNLEWATPKENIRHAFAVGLRDKKAYAKRARAMAKEQRKLSPKDIKTVRALYKKYNGTQESFLLMAMDRYGISRSGIWRILHKKTYLT